MKNYISISIAIFIFLLNCLDLSSQIFPPKDRQIRAFGFPMGTAANKILRDSSKTYKITMPEIQCPTKVKIYQSEFNRANNKINSYLLYEKECEKGESFFFSISINHLENKFFIIIPGVAMGGLNFLCNNQEVVKCLHVETDKEHSFIFYIDKKDNKIEKMIEKFKKDIMVDNNSDLEKIWPFLQRFYIIHYKYQQT